MAEVTLISPATQVQTIGAGGQQAQNATQTGVPAAVHLSPGSLIAGIITGKDASGGYMLKTDQGTFTLHSDTPLTYNSDVLIRVDTSTGSNAAARIITVNGETFSSFSAPLTEETDSLSPSLLAKTGNQTTAQGSSAVTGDTAQQARPVNIPALTVPTPPALAATLPQSPVPEGTEVVLHLPAPAATAQPQTPAQPGQPQAAPQASQQPAPPGAQQQPAASAQTATAQPAPATSTQQAPAYANVTQTPAPPAPVTAATTTTPATPSPPAPVTTSQAAVPAPTADATPSNVAKLIVSQPQALVQEKAPSSFFTTPAATQQTPQSPAVQTPQYAAYTHTATTAPPAAPVVLNANVVATHPDNSLTLLSPQGALTIKPENLPPTLQPATGTPVSVSIPVNSLTALFAKSDLNTQTPVWGTLKQIFTVIEEKAPALTQQLYARLPSIGSNFLSGSLLFAAALLQGNARKLLGDNVTNALQDIGSGDLVEKLSSQAESAAKSFLQPAEGKASAPSWQALMLPYVYQGAIQEARLYVKREPPRKEREGKKTEGDTRFIVEVTFSDIGELQLDGLVLPRDKATMFDLIVRTQTPFTQEEKSDILQIYNSAAEMTGFKGTIGFSVSREFPVKPLAEMNLTALRDIIA